MTRTPLVMLMLVTACGAEPPPWRLVGLYDAASLESPPNSTAQSMVIDDPLELDETCGAPKVPTGLGIQEWRAMSRGLTPTLVIALERTDGGEAPLLRGDVQVSVLDEHGDPIRLEPAVSRRQLELHLAGSRQDPKLRRQLAYGLCLEHLVGRGWTGAEDPIEVNQAFQLASAGEEERYGYFVGQARPVPALLGKPYACVVEEGQAASTSSEGARSSDPSTVVGPLDIWGAALPSCPEDGADVPSQVTILRDGETWTVRWEGPYWRGGEEVSLEDLDCRMGAPSEEQGSCDLLASVPYVYPDHREGGRTTSVLMIPAWQVGHALAADPNVGTSGADPVGWLLDHPSRLQVLVRPGEDVARWYDVNARKTPDGLAWGYVEGLVAARSPLLGLGPEAQVAPVQTSLLTDHHAHLQAAFLAGTIALVWALLPGLRRIRDLRTPIPEEPVEYWPEAGPRRKDQK